MFSNITKSLIDMRTSVVSITPTGSNLLIKAIAEFSPLSITSNRITEKDSESNVKLYIAGFGENVKVDSFIIGQRVLTTTAAIREVDVPENERSMKRLKEHFDLLDKVEINKIVIKGDKIKVVTYLLFNEFSVGIVYNNECDPELRTLWEAKVQQA